MHLKLPLGLILMWICCASGVVDIEAKRCCGTCTYVDQSYIHGHHVSKHFCTPVINEVCSDSQEGNFWVGDVPRKTSYCSLLLQTGKSMATVRDSRHYSNDLLQGGLKGHLIHFFVYGRSAC